MCKCFELFFRYMQQDLAIAKSLGDTAGECRAHGNLGSAYFSQGSYKEALTAHRYQLVLAMKCKVKFTLWNTDVFYVSIIRNAGMNSWKFDYQCQNIRYWSHKWNLQKKNHFQTKSLVPQPQIWRVVATHLLKIYLLVLIQWKSQTLQFLLTDDHCDREYLCFTSFIYTYLL